MRRDEWEEKKSRKLMLAHKGEKEKGAHKKKGRNPERQSGRNRNDTRERGAAEGGPKK